MTRSIISVTVPLEGNISPDLIETETLMMDLNGDGIRETIEIDMTSKREGSPFREWRVFLPEDRENPVQIGAGINISVESSGLHGPHILSDGITWFMGRSGLNPGRDMVSEEWNRTVTRNRLDAQVIREHAENNVFLEDVRSTPLQLWDGAPELRMITAYGWGNMNEEMGGNPFVITTADRRVLLKGWGISPPLIFDNGDQLSLIPFNLFGHQVIIIPKEMFS